MFTVQFWLNIYAVCKMVSQGRHKYLVRLEI